MRTRTLSPVVAFAWLSFACSAQPATFPPLPELPPEATPAESAAPIVAETATPVTSASASAPAPAPPPPMVELEAPEIEAASSLATADPRYRDVEALVRAKHWAKAKKALDPIVATEDAGHRYDRLVAGKALSAWLSGLDGDAKASRAGSAEVLSAWSDPAKSVARIADEAVGADETEKNHRIGRALVAVGQATYARAEEARLAAVKVSFPSFRGARTKDAVVKFVNKEVASWIGEKRDAIEKAEQSYQKVLELQPAPPPRWVIASSERVGTMWTDFIDDFAKAPQPKEWDASPEIREAYLEAISSMSEPFRARARGAFTACVGFSDKFRIEDDHSRICRKRLAPPP